MARAVGHRRKPLRAELYDYREAGSYFVTTVTHHRALLFGEIVEGFPVLNPAGREIERYWLELEKKYQQVQVEDYVIMPNHLHGIVRFHSRDALTNYPQTLGDVMKWFKSMTTNAYIRGVKSQGWPRFNGKLWQTGYWDHIIRNDADLIRVQDYIAANPFQWEMDPDNATSDQAW